VIADTLRLYLRYLGVSVRAQMQYRASFLMMSFGHGLITGIEFLAMAVLFARFGSLRGWTLPEVALLYGLVNMAFALADAVARGFDMSWQLLKSGDFDRLLLRPRSTALQLAGQELVLRRVGRFAQGLAVFLWAASALHLAWTPARLALVAGAIAGGACFFVGLFVLQATLSFWTIETIELGNMLTYGGVETAQYPLSIYRRWFRGFFTAAVPLAFVSYFPGLALLGRTDQSGLPAALLWCSPLVGVLFLIVALRLWRFGDRQYLSTGS
jgi:ABC-2 type transport system permease protein